MNDTALTLRRATDADFDHVESLLDRNGLPTMDVEPAQGSFYLASDDTDVVGIGGLEIYGTDALLRSVVVTEPNRRTGIGRTLCETLEEQARTTGVSTLYLLTTTATGFFQRCGYRVVDRETAPPRIQETPQFREHCPSSADCMKKEL